MKILGLSFDYHDSAAALVIDGRVVAAAQEERFSRKKNDKNFPSHAINFVLKSSKINSLNELDAVVFYEQPKEKLKRIFETEVGTEEQESKIFNRILARWACEGRLDYRDMLSKTLNIAPDKIKFVSHHDSHAAAAFYSSPFKEALVITIDGVGEFETSTISVVKTMI